MVLKDKDSLVDRIQWLELSVRSARHDGERQRLEKDLAQLRAGAKGEQETAYQVDFHLKDSPNWAVIHDLRLEWNGRVAQIDHLLIDRLLEVFVVESKSFRTKLRYANGGWERLSFGRWEGIPSPVEQNERHILVLKDLIDQLGFAPTRFGLVLQPVFLNYVVVQPSCSILGDIPKSVRIHRMDDLVAAIRKDAPSPLSIMKVIGSDALMAFATHLVACHKPAPKSEPNAQQSNAMQVRSLLDRSASSQCQGCGGPLTTAESKYCLGRKTRFAGQVLCRKCQKLAPETMPVVGTGVSRDVTKPAAHCAECGSWVDGKVLFFCRINSERFRNRVLCRNCQNPAAGI